MSGWNRDTEQAAIGETANDALVAEATAPLVQYTPRVDALLEHAAALRFTEQDFVDLAVAAADQAGMDAHGLREIANVIGLRTGMTPQWGIRS